MLVDMDESFRNIVIFEDNSKVSVMDIGGVRIHTKENSNQIISNIFFLPSLKTKLLSIGQLCSHERDVLWNFRMGS